MPKTWGFAVLIWIAFTATAGADTVYLQNGETVWGSSTYEEGDAVVVVRPSGKIRIPKAQVSRIEGLKSSLPPFYSPQPAAAPAGTGGGAPAGASQTPGHPGGSVTGAAPAPSAPGAPPPEAGAPAVAPGPPPAAQGPPPSSERTYP